MEIATRYSINGLCKTILEIEVKYKKMKYNYIVLFIVCCVLSCNCHSKSYDILTSREVHPKDSMIIDNRHLVFFKADSTMSNLIMYYKTSNYASVFYIDSVDFTPYESYIHIFNRDDGNCHVILWETRYEQMPVTIAYYIHDDMITKIGKIDVSIVQNKSDLFIFPIDKITIKQYSNNIKICFPEQHYYMTSSDGIIVESQKAIDYIYRIVENELSSELK